VNNEGQGRRDVRLRRVGALIDTLLLKRELVTVIAALRVAQHHGFLPLTYEPYFRDQYSPLPHREIDELCRNLEYPGG